VRTAVSIGALPASAPAKFAAYFADEKANVFALDAETGKQLWSVSVDDHALARITGAPKLFKGRLYVPVSSMEEVGGGTPNYPCCTFRGSVVAVDAVTGKILWKSYSIQAAPKPTRKNDSGTQMYGPAGGAIWNSPTIDEKRKLLYVGTGDSYTDVATDSTDAVIALDLATGKRVWTSQARKHDDWLVGCSPGQTPGNCPKAPGPDFDFGASPILHTLPNGKQVILAGAKSGVVYGFDPDAKGKILWQNKIGEGSNSGSIVWGPAADRDALYVSIGDVNAKPPYEAGGVTALDPATGEKLWHTPAPAPVCGWGTVHCSKAQPSGVTAIPGLVFVGSWDGHIRGYAAKDGSIVWDYDTGHAFDAVNGGKANGGAIDMGGQVIANGMLFVNSGVTPVQHPGNALLAFTVDGK
jgi:polyvinyl alcohol dehydrogenase (cytochrome)